MRCAKVLWSSFEKKQYIKTIDRLKKQSELCTFSQEKVKFYSNDLKMKVKIEPPESVCGMKMLDRSAFKKTITVPSLTVENQNLNVTLKLLKDYLLKMLLFKPVQEVKDCKKVIFLNPEKVGSWNDLKDLQEKLNGLNIQENNFSETSIELGYENWKSSELLKAILPKDGASFSSFSQIGHIVHLNFKDHLLDYKQIIGEILLDKIVLAKTVVYKKKIIDNPYRTFDMELICGEPDFMALVKEYNCIFEFDFSKVYWNPRLSTEHKRIVSRTNFGDVLFDVFAGVGPFAIPAAKKKCMVHANDLNPESYKWLNHNITLNKKCKDYIKTYNKDGGDFILNNVKEELLKIWQQEFFHGKIHVVMNLPVLAPSFLKYFKGLFKTDDLKSGDAEKIFLPVIHCYFFSKEENEREVFERESQINLDGIEHEFQFVRSVSNSSQMHRITFTLPRDYLFQKSVGSGFSEPFLKKMRTN